jgi:ribosome maturation factor RimP
MIDRYTIESIVNEQLNPEIEFLVEVNVSSSNRIMVVIDSEAGITIDKCVEISRYIEQKLDRDNEDFELEVASAGLSEPLKVPRQFKKNIGRNIDITLPSGLKLKGCLTDANDNSFSVETEQLIVVEGKKRKQKVVQHQTYAYTEIKSAFIVISFR